MENYDNDHILDDEFNSENDPWAGVSLAGFWARTGAALIDGLVMSPVSFLVLYFSGSVTIGLLSQLVYPVYKIMMEANYGATLGKMALQLRVVNQDAGPIDLNQSIKRYAIYGMGVIISLAITAMNLDPTEVMSSPIMGLQGIASLAIFVSVIFVAFDDYRQALHDKFAETYVINNNRKPY